MIGHNFKLSIMEEAKPINAELYAALAVVANNEQGIDLSSVMEGVLIYHVLGKDGTAVAPLVDVESRYVSILEQGGVPYDVCGDDIYIRTPIPYVITLVGADNVGDLSARPLILDKVLSQRPAIRRRNNPIYAIAPYPGLFMKNHSIFSMDIESFYARLKSTILTITDYRSFRATLGESAIPMRFIHESVATITLHGANNAIVDDSNPKGQAKGGLALIPPMLKLNDAPTSPLGIELSTIYYFSPSNNRWMMGIVPTLTLVEDTEYDALLDA